MVGSSHNDGGRPSARCPGDFRLWKLPGEARGSPLTTGLPPQGRRGVNVTAQGGYPKNAHPTIAKTGNNTVPDHAMKAKKLGIAIPRSTAMA